MSVFMKGGLNRLKKLDKKEAVVFTLFLLFAWFLMAKTFRLNTEGNLEIATKAWSDFAATIPLIRSFSLGDNFPPQYPLFAGPPIRYHFVFFLAVGTLEKLGLSLPSALNLLSTLSFSFLLALIYLLGKQVFGKKSVGLLAVVLFLFNGSFSFLEFFKEHPLSISTISNIVRNDTFPSFGPYDGKIVSAFWNLNIFTNQRHLALAYAAFLFLILIIYKASKSPKSFITKKSLLLGIFIGFFPYVHLAVFAMMGIALISSFILYPKLRVKVLTASILATILAFPQLAWLGPSRVNINLFSPGYLVDNLTLAEFLRYWFLNLGLVSFLAPIGFIFSDKKQRKLFIPFLFLFVVGNLFQFSPEMAANHKFFNLFLIGANLFTSYLLVSLWKKGVVGKLVVPALLFFLTASGIIDIFPILNDRFMIISDYPNNKTAKFILENTPPDSVFLNASFLYDPASLAGRKIYLGWPYFAWSAGYDTTERDAKMQTFLAPSDKENLCASLKTEGINYVELQKPTTLESISIDYEFFDQSFNKIHENSELNIKIYEVKSSCANEVPLGPKVLGKKGSDEFTWNSLSHIDWRGESERTQALRVFGLIQL